MKLIQNSEKRVFKSGSHKSLPLWILCLRYRSPKRISSNMGPISQRCKNFEKLGNVFDMKLIQNSEIRVSKSGIPQMSSIVDIMSWTHSLGPPKGISSNVGPICLRFMSFEKLRNVFDMKLIQDSEIGVFKSGIPQKPSAVDNMSWINSLGPPRESVAIYDQFCRVVRISKTLGNVFDMKLFQNSEIRVFNSRIPRKSSTVDIISWIHSRGPPRQSVAK